MAEIESFEEDLAAFERSVGGARTVLAEFSGAMRSMQTTVSDTKQEVAGLQSGLSRGLKSSLEGLVFNGDSFSQSLKGTMKSALGSVYKASVSPMLRQASGAVATGLSGAMQSLVPFASGGVFGGGRAFSRSHVVPFASGGIVDRPTTFPMRGGTGLMGEAGPEAVLPLSRGADGRLGVRSQSGGQQPVRVVMNISTPDVESFRRSKSQIAAQMGRALSRGSRNS